MTLDAKTRPYVMLALGLCMLPLMLQLELPVALTITGTALLTTIASWRHPLPALLKILLLIIVVTAVFMVYRGFGRDTGCALLAAMLAIKPSETLTVRDGRSLVGFATFAPFSTYLLDQSPTALILGAIAIVAAILVLMRLADLENHVDSEDWSYREPLRATGKLLLTGLPLAMAAFWLFPRLPTPLWGLPEKSVSKVGLGETMKPGEWSQLLIDDTPAMRVRFQGAPPNASDMYWRGTVFWDFDGVEWKPADKSAIDTAGRSLIKTTAPRWHYTADVEPTDRKILPLLEFSTTVPEGVRMDADGALRTDNTMTQLTRWQVDAAPAAQDATPLSRFQMQRALRLPNNLNGRTRVLGAQWRTELGANDEAIVQRALDTFHKDFTYSLTVPQPGLHWIDDFMFQNKIGFCEHYSTAFVVLMRAAGIPARVVTGYAGGFYNKTGDYWLIRNSDAHAWAEVWLRGRGWTRVDPTAAVAAANIYDTLEERAPGRIGSFAGLQKLWEVSDTMRRGWNDFVLGFDSKRQASMFKRFGIDKVDSSTLIALFVLAVGIAMAWMVLLLRRGERIADPLLRAWHQLSKRYSKHGLGRAPHEPVSAWVDRIAKARPADAVAMRGLASRFSDVRYARGETAASIKQLIRDIRRIRP